MCHAVQPNKGGQRVGWCDTPVCLCASCDIQNWSSLSLPTSVLSYRRRGRDGLHLSQPMEQGNWGPEQLWVWYQRARQFIMFHLSCLWSLLWESGSVKPTSGGERGTTMISPNAKRSEEEEDVRAGPSQSKVWRKSCILRAPFPLSFFFIYVWFDLVLSHPLPRVLTFSLLLCFSLSLRDIVHSWL